MTGAGVVKNRDLDLDKASLRSLPAGAILSAHEREKLDLAQSILDDAQTTLKHAQAQAKALLNDHVNSEKIRIAQSLAQDYARESAKISAEFQVTLQDLKPVISDTVGRIVRSLIGEIPDEKRMDLLVSETLRNIDGLGNSKIICASDSLEQMEAVVRKIEMELNVSISVSADPSLEPGRAILTTMRGHIEIGEQAILQDVLGDWTKGAEY